MQFNELAATLRNNARAAQGLTDDRARNLEVILEVTKRINQSLVLQEVLELVLSHAIRTAQAERGFLLLADARGGLHQTVAQDASGRALEGAENAISRTIVEDVFATGESICVENAQMDDVYDRRESIRSLELETILCSPLVVHEEKIGVIYVDSRRIQPVHKEEIINLFEILAGQAAIAIKNAQLYENLHKAFQELETTNERLIAFERMATKGEMAAEVSHELNNLLNVVLFQLASFRKGFDKLPKRDALAKLDTVIQSVRNIGVFSNALAEESSLRTKMHPGNFNECIERVVRFVQPLHKFRDAAIDTTLDGSIPEFAFDGQQMQQVVLNFLNNAVEACNEAQISIVTRNLPAEGMVSLIVKDNGPGIAEEVLQRLFVEKVTTKPTGHGYGLPICRKIIENHKGSVCVHSTVGDGTQFIVRVPTAT